MNKSVCLIIPTFNRISWLSILLEQIRKQHNHSGVQVQILVVDDGSTDGTPETLRTTFPEVAVLSGPGDWWWTKSVNEGIRHALSVFHPDYFLLLNDDSQIKEDYLDAMMKAVSASGDDAIIGSISVTDTQPYRVSFAGVKSINWVSLKKHSYHKTFEPLENLPLGALVPTYALNGRGTLLSAGLIRELGLLDEKAFPQYGSDDDLALRAWKNGNRALIAYDCRVYDRTGDTSKGSALRQDSVFVFVRSFFIWNSVNYIPKQARFFYRHGIKMLLPYYLLKFIAGTSYAWLFKYKKIVNEI